jgi:hypothetical protein
LTQQHIDAMATELVVPAWLLNSNAKTAAAEKPERERSGRRGNSPVRARGSASSAASAAATGVTTAPAPPKKQRKAATEDDIDLFAETTPSRRSGATEGRKKQSARTGSTASDLDFKKLVIKSELNLHQRQRLLESAVLVTQTCTTAHAVPTAIRQRGTDYHERTFGASGHTEGPPGPHLAAAAAITAFACTQGAAQTPFRNFVEHFCTPITHDANSTQCQRQLAIEQTKTDGKDATAIIAELNRREVAFTRDKMSLELQVFKIRIMKSDKENCIFQFASRSQLPVVTAFLQGLLELLSAQAAGVMKYGMAPPSGVERALKKMLADLE